jgi:hypothetical protein
VASKKHGWIPNAGVSPYDFNNSNLLKGRITVNETKKKVEEQRFSFMRTEGMFTRHRASTRSVAAGSGAPMKWWP